MELKDIKKVVQMMKENDLTEFLLEDESCTLQMKRGSDNAPQVIAAPQMVAAPSVAPAPAVSAPAAEAAPAAADEGLVEITSPMVGTFYTAPSPDADAFVAVGAEVTADTVVCIVEAMKVMNEIKADVKGTIKKILVDNASPVQFGQPLFLVDPA
ncbi:acetyl-CoA carboxylase biotin carboxyl carrier protein [Tichowtungia aerotolerans]|uniref:Biotin carboxyl carrier protein of acetyl-CoA carboxylase n=1 Tax=Tichowtungia aerotolerans TaxID=2697043 RepID=A0A6P1M5F9_9BACT|nr:acetyl-CoA carboxylase biotin carboxyl carrier protein [Tichowtungia aerotolerans]QHI68233.1 acetyl-CoA carboxylase biotin carboxyl carrier protein [Tichowtungia aerotolerans]